MERHGIHLVPGPRTGRAVRLSDLVREWTEEGLIGPEQGRAILARGERTVLADLPRATGTAPLPPQPVAPVAAAPATRAPAPPPGGRARSLVLEALGYLGAAIVLAGAIALGARYWSDLGETGRVLVLGAGAVALVVGGALVPVGGRRGPEPRDAGPAAEARARLRSALWLAAAVATAATLGVAGDELGLHDADLAVTVGSGTTLLAGALWWRWPTPLQQAVTMVAAALTCSALIARQTSTDSLPGLGVWTVGVVWWLLARGGVVRPRRLGGTAGAVMAIIGAMATSGGGGVSDAGTWLVLLTLAGVVALGLVTGDVMLLGVGAVGVVMNVPQAVARWFPGSLAAPLTLLLLGLAVVALAVYAARRTTRRTPTAAGGHAAPAAGSGRAAAWLNFHLTHATAEVGAVVVVVAVAALVAAIG